ncbi:hypothetical protein V6N12_058370 [Hibiscus sabdariffa]|uniref:DUF4283 domain-containing protein n=1 Tax=Hibiscus sabdariffa TaxID=183260 RepID=A0ABR2ERY1_9ROSI
MECVAPADPRPIISYKDMVIGSNGLPSSENTFDLDDDDIECDQNDFLKVLTEGPWTIFGRYISVEPLFVDFKSSQASSSRLMAWI